jgi:CTP synthase
VTPEVDVVICEIGGTVGDIESLPFLEALRLFRADEGRTNCFFIHVTLVPYLHMAGEVKTKPTQHSVGRLREIGIIPDMIVCRTEVRLDKDVRKKISLFCNVDEEAVVEAIDVENTIYELPLEFAAQDIDTIIIDGLGLRAGRRNLRAWRDYVDRTINAEQKVEIAIVGKYCELIDAYKSIRESLHHGGAAAGARVSIRSVSAEEIEEKGAKAILAGIGGILVPGGFGGRGVEGKILAVKYARENKIPYFGICYGMHMAVIELARNVLKLPDADTTENNPNSKNPVIHLMEEQKKVMNLGGTMRLGAFPCDLAKGSLVRKTYGKDQISERHRHRYEFNNDYRKQFEDAGMALSGISPNGMLVEIVELKGHPWFVGVQFHPEFKSRPIDPHPLFRDFVAASVKNTRQE